MLSMYMYESWKRLEMKKKIIRVKITISDKIILPYALFTVPGDLTFENINHGISTGMDFVTL